MYLINSYNKANLCIWLNIIYRNQYFMEQIKNSQCFRYKFVSEQHTSLCASMRSTWAELALQTLLFVVQLLQYTVLLTFDLADCLADLRVFLHHLRVTHPNSLVVVLDPKLQVFPVICTIYVFISSRIWLIYILFLSNCDMTRVTSSYTPLQYFFLELGICRTIFNLFDNSIIYRLMATCMC